MMQARTVMNLRSALLAGAALVGSFGPALAQDAPSKNAPNDDSVISEVTVTAQKRPENAQNVPISLTAFSASDLVTQNVTQAVDLAYMVPNLNIESSGSSRSPRISLRGIYSESSNGGIENSVPVTINGVTQGRASTLFGALYDIDNIEVLEGPQGTLYGGNSIAGIINVTTNDPRPKFGADAEFLAGNYGYYETKDDINLPLSDRVFLRVAADFDHRDGWGKDATTNKELDNVNDNAARVSLKALVTDNIDVTLRAEVSSYRSRTADLSVIENGVGFLPSTIGGFLDTNLYSRTVYQDFTPGEKKESGALSMTWNWRLGGGFTLTSITGYQTFLFKNFVDSDYTNLDILNTGFHEHQNQFSQEIKLTSPSQGPIKYVAGVYYFHQALADEDLAQLGPGASALGIPSFLLPANYNIASGVINTDDYALYGNLTYTIIPKLDLNLGGRIEEVNKKLTFTQGANPILGFDVLDTEPSLSNKEFSPEATLEYHFTPQVQAYAKAARAFKSGGYDLSTISCPSSGCAGVSVQYKPEYLDDYEAGFKSSWFHNRLQINGDIFNYNYTNLQVNALGNNGFITIVEAANAAKATSKGGEFTVIAIPVEGLKLNFSYGYTDAKYKSFPNADSKGDNYSGNPLPLAVKNSFEVGGEYELPKMQWGSPYVSAEYLYRSKTNYQSSNAPQYELTPVKDTNFRVGMYLNNGVELAVWGKNVFNTKETTTIIESPFFAQYVAAFAPPATFGVDLRAKF